MYSEHRTMFVFKLCTRPISVAKQFWKATINTVHEKYSKAKKIKMNVWALEQYLYGWVTKVDGSSMQHRNDGKLQEKYKNIKKYIYLFYKMHSVA